jgi:hypothetical protein
MPFPGDMHLFVLLLSIEKESDFSTIQFCFGKNGSVGGEPLASTRFQGKKNRN